MPSLRVFYFIGWGEETTSMVGSQGYVVTLWQTAHLVTPEKVGGVNISVDEQEQLVEVVLKFLLCPTHKIELTSIVHSNFILHSIFVLRPFVRNLRQPDSACHFQLVR